MILVHIETDLDGTASEVSLEAVTFARNLSAEGGGVPVDAVVFNDLSEELHKELAAYGVRTVHRVGGDDVAAYSGAGWASAILTRPRGRALGRGDGRRHRPRHGADGPRRAPAPAWRWPPTSSPSPAWRRSWSPARSPAAPRARRWCSTSGPAVFTVAGHALEATPATEPGPADVIEHTPEIDAADLVARVVSSEEPEEDLSGDLSSARVVVGAGRGRRWAPTSSRTCSS